MSPPYLIPSQIKEIFENRHNQSVFNSHFADNASIIIVGQDDTIGGHYKSTQHFDEVVFDRMSATMKMETARMEVVQVIGGGESATAAVEIVARCTTKLGESFITINHPRFILLSRSLRKFGFFSLSVILLLTRGAVVGR